MAIISFKSLKLFLAILITVILFSIISCFFILFKGVNLKLLGLKFAGKPICQDCNIILISLDTLSANHLPCYGYERNTAPNLCKFAQDNILFNNSYANATFTLPSHVTMFTGLLPSSHNVNAINKDRLDSQVPFLPEILQSNGYETDFYISVTDDYIPIDKVYYRGINNIIDTNSVTNTDLKLWKEGLQKLKENAVQGQKTFLFLHTYFVHSPYLIGNDKPIFTQKYFTAIPTTNEALFSCSKDFAEYFIKAFKTDVESNYWGDKTATYKSYLSRINANVDNPDKVCEIIREINSISFESRYYPQNVDKNDPEQVEYIKALYDQRIHQLDDLLATILELFQKSDYRNSTVIIITADHGEEFMEHGYIRHETLYDSNLRIPIIMYIPGIAKRKISQLAQSADLMPTILDLVGINKDSKLQGESLVNEIFWGSAVNKYIAAENINAQKIVIRDKEYKLFAQELGKDIVPFELYDTSRDPKETTNIIFKYPDVVAKLKNELSKILSN